MARDLSENGLALLSVSIVMSVLQVIFVALMFYTRRLLREKYGWDAWIMLIALVGVLGPCARELANMIFQFGSLAKAGVYIASKDQLTAITDGQDQILNRANIIPVVEYGGLGQHFSDMEHPKQSFIFIKKVFFSLPLNQYQDMI